ncbi:MAG: YqgE/AlgH family protein [Alphaproteobacteria bacterium]|nr:YqgE/AlgH family protein [Alphaproteobacteria bacterium]
MPARRIRISRALSAMSSLLAVLMICGTAPSVHSDASSLAGQLLIASPTIGDPRFAHTVILMVRHDKEGAFGIVINRPVGERAIADLLEASGQDDADVAGTVRVFAGGPVQPELGFVVHSTEYRRAETIDVDGRVAMTASRQILLDIGRSHGPEKSLFALGYAGWGPGQLEDELARNNWFTTPEEPKLVFDDDRGNLWDEAMARRTREL